MWQYRLWLLVIWWLWKSCLIIVQRQSSWNDLLHLRLHLHVFGWHRNRCNILCKLLLGWWATSPILSARLQSSSFHIQSRNFVFQIRLSNPLLWNFWINKSELGTYFTIIISRNARLSVHLLLWSIKDVQTGASFYNIKVKFLNSCRFGKYLFTRRDCGRLVILRYGNSWTTNLSEQFCPVVAFLVLGITF